jgi:hypothetical protein
MLCVRKFAVHIGCGTEIWLMPVPTLMDITSNTYYKCTATLRTQFCRKCLRIKLNGFNPVQTVADIISNTFYKCTATFRTHCRLTLSLLMSYVYGVPCKARNFNVVYIRIWTYVWQRWKPSLSICCTMFQHWINAESFSVAQLCVNTLLLSIKVTLITGGI